MKCQIVSKRKQSDNLKLFAADGNGVADFHADVACMHSVDSNFRIKLRRTSFVKRSHVDGRIAFIDSDVGVFRTVIVVIFGFFSVEVLKNRHGHRLKVIYIKAVSLGNLVPFFIDCFGHFFVSFFVGFFHRLFELVGLTSFFHCLVEVLFYSSVDLRLNHFFVCDTVNRTLRAYSFLDSIIDFFSQVLFYGLGYFFVRFFHAFVYVVLSDIGHLAYA